MKEIYEFLDITIKDLLIGIIIMVMLLDFFVIMFLYNYTANKYDVNGDGQVNASDYVEIKKYIMEQE